MFNGSAYQKGSCKNWLYDNFNPNSKLCQTDYAVLEVSLGQNYARPEYDRTNEKIKQS